MRIVEIRNVVVVGIILLPAITWAQDQVVVNPTSQCAAVHLEVEELTKNIADAAPFCSSFISVDAVTVTTTETNLFTPAPSTTTQYSTITPTPILSVLRETLVESSTLYETITVHSIFSNPSLPSYLATFSSARISSACSCINIPQTTVTTTTTTFVTLPLVTSTSTVLVTLPPETSTVTRHITTTQIIVVTSTIARSTSEKSATNANESSTTANATSTAAVSNSGSSPTVGGSTPSPPMSRSESSTTSSAAGSSSTLSGPGSSLVADGSRSSATTIGSASSTVATSSQSSITTTSSRSSTTASASPVVVTSSTTASQSPAVTSTPSATATRIPSRRFYLKYMSNYIGYRLVYDNRVSGPVLALAETPKEQNLFYTDESGYLVHIYTNSIAHITGAGWIGDVVKLNPRWGVTPYALPTAEYYTVLRCSIQGTYPNCLANTQFAFFLCGLSIYLTNWEPYPGCINFSPTVEWQS